MRHFPPTMCHLCRKSYHSSRYMQQVSQWHKVQTSSHWVCEPPTSLMSSRHQLSLHLKSEDCNSPSMRREWSSYVFPDTLPNFTLGLLWFSFYFCISLIIVFPSNLYRSLVMNLNVYNLASRSGVVEVEGMVIRPRAKKWIFTLLYLSLYFMPQVYRMPRLVVSWNYISVKTPKIPSYFSSPTPSQDS